MSAAPFVGSFDEAQFAFDRVFRELAQLRGGPLVDPNVLVGVTRSGYVSWPGGTGDSSSITFTHPYGTGARFIGQLQLQTGVGAGMVGVLSRTSTSVTVFCGAPNSFFPSAGVTREITVLILPA